MRFFKALPLILLIFLFGCALPGQTAVQLLPTLAISPAPQTLAPSQAEIFATATLLPPVETLPAETSTATPPPLTLLPTYFNFPTATLTPTLDVSSHIQLRIVTPGPMSKVVSPIDFIAHVDPYSTGLTRIELLGEDGRELYRKIFRTYSNIGYFTRVEEKVTFELPGTAEVGRLQISTYDSKGNLQAFNSVRLLLLAVGENEFSPAYPAQERVGLRYPETDSEVLGGVLPVTGEINPINNTPLVLELFDTAGHLIGSRLLQLPPGNGQYQPFTTMLPYQINQREQAQLVIRQADDRISGLAYLYSLKFYISP